jgi:hypothetical protein
VLSPKLYVLQKGYAVALIPAVQPLALGKDNLKAGAVEDAYLKLLVSSDLLFKCSLAAVN